MPLASCRHYRPWRGRAASSPLLGVISPAPAVPVTTPPTGLAVPSLMPPPLLFPSFGDSMLRLLAVLPRLRWGVLTLVVLTVGEGILESRCGRLGLSPAPSKVLDRWGEFGVESSAATWAYDGSAKVVPEVSVVVDSGAVTAGLAVLSRAWCAMEGSVIVSRRPLADAESDSTASLWRYLLYDPVRLLSLHRVHFCMCTY